MNRLASVVLMPLSGLYGAAVKARLALYHAGIFRTEQVGAPVISVGNITAGGTGKTPLVEWIASYLARKGRRVCILTRGYGRETAHQRVVVSDGNSVLANVAHGGDEALLLAEKLAGRVAVIADADRVSAARWAVENMHSDVFILDDGFQNVGIARNLNIVTLDALNPWGGKRLLPAGLLREPRTGLKRADCIVVTRTAEANSLEKLRPEIHRFCGERPIVFSRMNFTGLRLMSAQNQEQHRNITDSDGLFAAFCGIGNPRSFFSQLRSSGHNLSYTRSFSDHHNYSQSDIDELQREATSREARALLTTAKDEVKLRALRFDLPCYVVDIEIQIDQEEELKTLVKQALHGV
jgi:tetraacyldisaccharide 4'-kinase